MGTLVTPLTRILGLVLLVVGLLGFVMPDPLLGIFKVDVLHNLVHIVSGVIGLAVAGNVTNARMYLIIFGLVYAVVALIGYVQGTTVLNIISVNSADNVLHALIGAVCLVVGFGSKS